MSIPITFDEAWLPGLDRQSSTRQVYLDHASIGRVRRWQKDEPSGLTREWFTAERMVEAFYEPIAGEHATFEEALERVIFYGVEE
ncbi:hypothetical protein [Methylobacterium platani]|uniref:Uncharacterized protein n=1 Tax=Methylobacterium platani TaxID=427683 RepID=A0A179S4H9_9HYPH|nr:hypothetical protein [Methylobacterium platani]OAS18938.1 hypothetical protein A5481_25370 [Methylobacterium platani]